MCNAGLILYSFKQVSMAIPICFGAGISLFCVPLYHKAFTKEETLSSKLPPFGGMGMILGWLLFSVL